VWSSAQSNIKYRSGQLEGALQPDSHRMIVVIVIRYVASDMLSACWVGGGAMGALIAS
jgi:hypothetical protein